MMVATLTDAAEPITVVYPNLNGNGKDQLGYKVLNLALHESGIAYDLTLSDRPANPNGAGKLLLAGAVSIWDTGTSRELEETFLPIYFPIDRGLNGWRLFVINKNNESQFAKIRNIQDLRHKIAGQASGAPDIAILENAGLTVRTGSDWPSMFPMIDADRFDFLPLGVNEVYGMLKKYLDRAPNEVIEKNVVLIYPFGRLFFVRRDNLQLRDAVLRGLVKAFRNGSFQRLFNSEPSQISAMRDAALKNRVMIKIDNPFMTEEFRKIPEKYFFKLTE